MKKQISNRILSAVSAAAMSVTAMGALPFTSAQAAGLTGQDAKGITSQMVIGWNLGNTLDCSGTKYKSDAAPGKFATAWGNPEPTAELVQTVKDGGFNTIRIPTTWYQHLEWDETSQMYLINDTWMDYVKQTVDYAYDRDMFIILNMHHEDFINAKIFTDETYAVASKKLEDIWKQVAEEFKDYDQHLIFEGMNEPRQTGNPAVSEWGNGTDDGGYTTKYVNDLNAVFVNAVRSQGSAANQERLLMLPGYVASSDAKAIRAIEIPANAGNVALSVHAYAPYFFTMATDTYANHEFPGKSGWGEDYEYALTNLFNTLNQIQSEKNAPIIIGEFSASDFGNTEDRARWATDYLTKAKAAGIPCVLWDNNVIGRKDGEAHGYVYRATNTWYNESIPVIKAMMAVYGINPILPEYSAYVKPAFDWSKINIGDNWIELYRSEDGKELEAWKNFTVSGWKDYVNENYDLVLIYDSDDTPELVLQGDGKDGSWNRVSSSDETDTMFMMTFTYDDMVGALDGETVADMGNLFISATMGDLTAYGLYAVPKGGVQQPTDNTDESVDTMPVFGDADNNGVVELKDIITLQKYILGVPGVKAYSTADMNADGVLDVFDLALLKRLVLNSK